MISERLIESPIVGTKMSVQPPRIFHRPSDNSDPITAALQHEILGEKASNLGRLQKKLEIALQDLRKAQDLEPDNEEQMKTARAEACQALWYVTIQRELCGLTQHKTYFDQLNVPSDVRIGMGPNLSNS